ncbi:MAG TPA: DUF2723 domain-containing protein, partial [Anaerolineae bacterium]|nr:DUF2723 domain-containing protein [Anaerolineae bacterium]
MNSGKVNIIVGWIIYAAIFVTYLLTVAPTITFWDTGEFITCAYIQGIPHPPGSPLLSLVGRVMSIVPFYVFRGGGFEHIAYRINLIAVLTGAFTALFAYFIIVKLISRISPLNGTIRHDGVTMFSAAVATFLTACAHQFWENSIETETYMPSLLLSLLAIWLTLRWEERKNNPYAVRYIFLAAYLIGLGNGIHLYVLLVAPTVFLIIFLAKPSWFVNIRLWLACALVLLILAGLKFIIEKEIFFMVMILFALIVPFVFQRLYQSQTVMWKTTFLSMLLCLSLFAAGNSIYPTIIIRASKHPSINEGNPDNFTRYREYLEREQYGQGNMYRGMFTRKADMWYQAGFMYLRYLLQQFP